MLWDKELHAGKTTGFWFVLFYTAFVGVL